MNGDLESGFDLSFSSPEFEAFEARDTVLSELASGFFVAPPRRGLADAFGRLAATAPILDDALLTELHSELIGFYKQYLFEMPLVSKDGFRAAAGVCSQ